MAIKMRFELPQLSAFSGTNAAADMPIEMCIYGPQSNRTEINKLRFRAFRSAGWIHDSGTEEFSDHYDDLASAFSIGAFRSGTCLGTLRLAFGGRGYEGLTMPCQEQFPLQLAKLSNDRPCLVEFSRLAVEPSLTNQSARSILLASLVRAGVILATGASTDIAFIAVHRRVSQFYQSVCGFKIIAQSDRYAEIQEPTHLLGLTLREIALQRRRTRDLLKMSRYEVEAARQAMEALVTRKAA